MKSNFEKNIKVQYRGGVQSKDRRSAQTVTDTQGVTSMSQAPTSGNRVEQSSIGSPEMVRDSTKPLGNQNFFLSKCLGQMVKIYFLGHIGPLEAEILWFDHYCIGVEIDGIETMLFKHALEGVEKC